MTFYLFKIRRKYRRGPDEIRFAVARETPEARWDYNSADTVTNLGEIDLSDLFKALATKDEEPQ